MNTSKWGPPLWTFLHSVTFNYNPTSENNIYIYNLFENLKYTLPCKYCRESYKIFFEYINIKLFLDDKMGLTYWLYIVHNLVNLKLSKKTIPFENVVNYYKNFHAEKIDYSDFADKTKAKYRKIIYELVKILLKSGKSPIPKDNLKFI